MRKIIDNIKFESEDNIDDCVVCQHSHSNYIKIRIEDEYVGWLCLRHAIDMLFDEYRSNHRETYVENHKFRSEQKGESQNQ